MTFKKDKDKDEGLCPISGLPERIFSRPEPEAETDPFITIREQVEMLKKRIKQLREYYHNQRLRCIVDGDYRGESFLAYREYQTILPMKQELYHQIYYMPPFTTVNDDGSFKRNPVIVDLTDDGGEMMRILREAMVL